MSIQLELFFREAEDTSNEQLNIFNQDDEERELTFIDLFAGLGSFRLGFEAQGARCVFSSDIDKNVDKAYSYAYGDSCLNDIVAQDIDALPNFDILCGGFPCQPFSSAGEQLAFDDPRAATAFKTIDIIRERQPLAFVLENVKGIQTPKEKLGDSPLNLIRGMLQDCGYNVYVMLLNAYTHGGLPQNRERYFFIGYRKDLPVKLSQGVQPIPCTQDYRAYLEPGNSIDPKYTYAPANRVKTSWIFPHLDVYTKQPSCADYVYQIRASSHTVRQHKVRGRVPTLTKFMGTGGHNVPLIYAPCGVWRKLTPRECLNLQGYPPTFPMHPKLSDSAYYCIAGNSIPVPLSKRIAALIVNTLKA